MSDLKNWADNAELNVESSPNGWPEGMPPSAVNNSAREMMAALRRSYVRQPWFAPGGTIVRASESQITIADDAKVTNYSNYYAVGARVRIEYADGYVLGSVAESLYESPTSTISFSLDAEATLPATITDVYVGLSPEDITGITGPNLLGCVVGFTEEGSKIGAGLLLANGQKFNPSLYPDLATLYYQGQDEEDKPVYRYGRELVGDVYWPLRPDVRGYFPRFADDRTEPEGSEEDLRIDPEAPRTVGTTQDEATKSHYHHMIANAVVYESNVFPGENQFVAAAGALGSRRAEYTLNGVDSPGATLGKTDTVEGDETRPVNIAMVGVIVAYSGVVTSGLADVTELETFCTAERVRAEGAALSAESSAGTAEDKADAASASATLAQQWAVKMDGQVASTDYSSKYYAGQASTSATNAASSATLAQQWATSTTIVADGKYGSSYYALRSLNYMNGAETARDTARDWATKTDSAVSGSDYSAKYNANQAATSATTAQQWASKTSGTVDGTNYSAKYYAGQAAASASEAADIVASIGPVMRYRGSVATYADLPTATAVTGDVYNVTADGKNYAFTAGGTWDDFGGAITVSIAACTDVNLTSLADGDVLVYNSSTQKWENGQVRQTYRGVYDAAVTYAKGDIVAYGSYFYIAKGTTTGNDPNNSTYWSEISNDGLVNYAEKTDNVEYPVGFTNYGVSSNIYSGSMNFTTTSSPTINASTGALTAAVLKTTTQTQGDNSTNAATTAYVDTAVGGVTESVSSLTDVQLTTLTNGEALVYDSALGKWKNGAVAGGASYDSTTQTITL